LAWVYRNVVIVVVVVVVVNCCRCRAEVEKRRASNSSSLVDGDVTANDTSTVTLRAVAPRDGWSSDETRQGTVSLRTYAAYVTAAGGILAVVAVLIASVVAEGAKAFSFWWLAYWLEQSSGTTNVSWLGSAIARPLSLTLSLTLSITVEV